VSAPDSLHGADQGAPLRQDAFWMPSTSHRQFARDPRVVVGAEGAWYVDACGRSIFDGMSGIWTSGLGHGRKEIVDAVTRQMTKLDFVPSFQIGHPLAFQLADRIASLMPEGLDHVFFTGSGSDAVETAMKMARACWRLRGQAARTRFIGRAKGYHGVNFGGISVGGLAGNRKLFGEGVAAAHLPHTLLPDNAFSRGLPQQGAWLADELNDLIELHDPSTIAAVIVEPFAGSGGVIPPPIGYLQRLREICDQHGILLIFDEVITAFGRTGAWSGAGAFGVTPDLMTFAKQVTNGMVPMGGVVSSSAVHRTFIEADGPEFGVEFPHGYTYSAHPLACAAALATIDAIERDGVLAQVREASVHFEDAVHGLKGARHVVDVRNCGLAAGVALSPGASGQGLRGAQVAFQLWRQGFYVRYSGDTILMAPPFTSTRGELDALVNALGDGLSGL
jgi:beta-alanine--pyruvate transaminase